VAATAPLTSDHAGLNLELSRPFTVEGWFKPVDPGAAVRDVCCASNAAGDGYWRLCLVRDGTAVRLALQAVSPHAWTLWPVDAAFAADLSPHVGAWTHVALSYDPAVGKGTWTLLINGRDGGTLAQEMSPGLWPWGLTRFTLGSAEGGAFDEWRITRGVLTAKDILYCVAPGLAFVIR
jgi:hypothetical protein